MTPARHAPSAVPAPATPPEATPRLAGVEVTWRVARTALGDRAPEGTSRIVTLTLRIESPGEHARALLMAADGPAERTLERLQHVRAEVIDDIRGEVHVECPGVLHATLAPAANAWRLAYARTPLLDALGVPGGRAEPAGARAW